MKPHPPSLAERCPEVPPRLVEAHLERLEADYFQRFHEASIASHLHALAQLSKDHPAEVLVQPVPRRSDSAASESVTSKQLLAVTVLAFDQPFAFSLITGLLAATGFSIQAGDVYTYARAEPPPAPTRRRPGSSRRGSGILDPAKRRRIIDRFEGGLDELVSDLDTWSDMLQQRLGEVLSLLEDGERGAEQARQRVNEWVTQRLDQEEALPHDRLYPVDVRIDQDAENRRTRLNIHGQDTPAFLYALSTALSLHNLSIERVRIQSRQEAGHSVVEDEVYVVDRRGEPIQDEATLRRVRFSVVLTKHFTYFLDRAPDPHAALQRFVKLVVDTQQLPEADDWQEFLSRPRAMGQLARVLGASDYIWEDFIRVQYQALKPIFEHETPPEANHADDRAALQQRLDDKLHGAVGLAEQQDRLNAFKNEQLFAIDLDHVVNPATGFDRFSRRLTTLAEVLLSTATRLIHADLCRSHGEPRLSNGQPCGYALCGLGKLGGRALGYASDLELMFVYAGKGRSGGGKRSGLDNRQFFETLVQELSRFIRTRRDGIYEIDLRLRPHGDAGPLACSFEQFTRYYGSDGESHPLERMALVRLRAIGGDPELSRQVEAARDEAVYHGRSLDVPEMWAIWARQREEKVGSGRFNAKYSSGALSDLEGTVTLLQVQHARQRPELRTPEMHEALHRLGELSVLEQPEAEGLVETYNFFRRLINGLRMLRGSAKDLFLPPLESLEMLHLARRMGYRWWGGLNASRQLGVEISTHTAVVRHFIERRFGVEKVSEANTANLADLLLSDRVTPAMERQIVGNLVLRQGEAVAQRLKRLAAEAADRRLAAAAAVWSVEWLREHAEPMGPLSRWADWLQGCSSRRQLEHLRRMNEEPRLLHLLLHGLDREPDLAPRIGADPTPILAMRDRLAEADREDPGPSSEQLVQELLQAAACNPG